MLFLSVGSFASPVLAGTTSADFLKWEPKSQASFLHTSISMAATIATQVRPKVARCIDHWYFKSDEAKEARNAEIMAVMSKYTAYHPSSVLFAVIEKACGKFGSN